MRWIITLLVSLLFATQATAQVTIDPISPPLTTDDHGLFVRLSCDGGIRGSGARISDTTIITAAHVAKSLCLMGSKPSQFAGVVYRDEVRDFAILQTIPTNEPHWEIACTGNELLENYFAYGYAGGNALRLIILVGSGAEYSAVPLAVMSGEKQVIPGMSGGPVVDANGKLVGINIAYGKPPLVNLSFVLMLKDTPLCKTKEGRSGLPAPSF